VDRTTTSRRAFLGRAASATAGAAVTRCGSSGGGGQTKATTFQNDARKTKIETAIGAGEAPTISWGGGWGGGLKSHVGADDPTNYVGNQWCIEMGRSVLYGLAIPAISLAYGREQRNT
jgi:hypothetical protein